MAIEFAEKVAVTLSGRSPIVLPAGRYLYCGFPTTCGAAIQCADMSTN
jgi:hypothetical protein